MLEVDQIHTQEELMVALDLVQVAVVGAEEVTVKQIKKKLCMSFAFQCTKNEAFLAWINLQMPKASAF